MKRTIRRIVSVVAITTMSLAGISMAQNWPSFRGPNGSGLGTGSPPTKWNVESGENIKWKVKVPGLGHSSPIVWGDRIFLTTAVSVAGEESLQTGWLQGTGDSPKESGEWEWQVLALDKATGKTLWTQTATKGVPKFKRHIKATHANSTPATDGKHVVAFFGSEGLYCYDLDGKLLWKKDLGSMNVGPAGFPDMQWGAATSPIIHEDKVILQLDYQGSSSWAAFDINTGSELMRIDRGDDPTWTTPSIYQGKGGTQLVCNGYKKMAGYDLATGKELWQIHDGGDVPVPRPVIFGDIFFLTNGHGRSPIYAVKADASGDITPAGEDKTSAGLAWYKPVKGSYMPTPIVVDGVLYVASDNGIYTGFDAKTGEQIVRERVPAGGNSTFSASPVAADGRIYTTSEDGQIDVLRAGKQYEVLASNRMGETCMATPAISDGLLIVRGKDHLFCIGK
ncbi:MAG: PQQ-binding-like beta-propeller repeat protein [Planctomycetes bacterium]|nr:PQQ-binding-like beta-propeller repeat protein [Planctomycetota bacterium]MBI3832715.1 PQQ-binding-like beta-propeller repeat protein [Planctomycetota bacterium]